MDYGKRVFNAAQEGDLDKLQKLLNEKKDIISAVNSYHHDNKNENFITTPLGIAAKEGYKICVKFLIEKCYANVDGLVNNQNREYFPPLWCAAANNHLNVVVLLVERGANVDVIVPHTGETPLRAACFAKNLDIVKYLIEKKADVEIADNSKFTCLMLASRTDSLDIVKYLVKVALADVNRKDINGTTALLCAAESNTLDSVTFLLKWGAKLDVVDLFGNTPLLNAVLKGSIHIAHHFIYQETSKKQEIHALELLGATCVRRNRLYEAANQWKIALHKRYEQSLLYDKKILQYSPLVMAFDNNLEEFTSKEQLNAIREDSFKMLMQSLIIMERILGPTNYNYVSYVKELAEKYEKKNELNICLRFFICYAEITQTIDCFSDNSLQAFSKILNILSKVTNDTYYGEILIRILKMSVDCIERKMLKLENKEKIISSEETKNYDNSLLIPLYLIDIITKNLHFLEANTKTKKIINRLISLDPKTISNKLTLYQLAKMSDNSKYGVEFPNSNIIGALLLV